MMKISNAKLRSQVKWKRPGYADSEGTDEGGVGVEFFMTR
jgi:hypothetical protein